jgi:hypothetical protein
MANPLPTPQLRYHSKHSKPSVTAPLSVSDLPLPPLPELKVGGFGLNLVELVELGVKLSKDPMGAFSDVLRAFGVDLASGLLDRLWDPLDDLLMYAWKGLNIAWPAFRDFMGLVQNVFENLLLSIYYRITGKLQNPGNPGRGDLRCECDTPTTEGKLDRRAYEALPFGTEISKRIITLIKELMPEVWTYRDDIPTTSVKYFVESSKLRRCARYHKDSGRALDAYDVHDHIAQRGDLHDTAPPYTRAWKWNNSQLFVEVGFLRMYSFLPEGSTTSSYDTEHEGDGERMFMILDVLPVCEAPLQATNPQDHPPAARIEPGLQLGASPYAQQSRHRLCWPRRTRHLHRRRALGAGYKLEIELLRRASAVARGGRRLRLRQGRDREEAGWRLRRARLLRRARVPLPRCSALLGAQRRLEDQSPRVLVLGDQLVGGLGTPLRQRGGATPVA